MTAGVAVVFIPGPSAFPFPSKYYIAITSITLPSYYCHFDVIKTTFFCNWDSLHGRLNSHYNACSNKKKKNKNFKGYRKPV